MEGLLIRFRHSTDNLCQTKPELFGRHRRVKTPKNKGLNVQVSMVTFVSGMRD
jgi:hypothetical protein